jgi:brefeldin A-inhibited guanine nucleotide-exchange protein
LGVLESKSPLAIAHHQKVALLRSICNICADPQTLIEIYLNYDCDPEALDNMFERIVNVLSKVFNFPLLP